MSKQTSRLSTRSYALLGLLRLRPWTTYELAREMRRNLHFFWRRAESGLYAETKRLAQLGLASAERSFTGRRARTRYTLTAAGTHAVDRWLETQPQGFSLESEALLRILLAQLGTHEQLLRALEQVEADADAMLARATAIAHEYLDGQAPFQDVLHLRAFLFDVLWHHAWTFRLWASRTREQVERWPDLSPEGKSEHALALFAQVHDPPGGSRAQ